MQRDRWGMGSISPDSQRLSADLSADLSAEAQAKADAQAKAKAVGLHAVVPIFARSVPG